MLHYQISELNDKMGLEDIRQRPILNREMELGQNPERYCHAKFLLILRILWIFIF